MLRCVFSSRLFCRLPLLSFFSAEVVENANPDDGKDNGVNGEEEE